MHHARPSPQSRACECGPQHTARGAGRWALGGAHRPSAPGPRPLDGNDPLRHLPRSAHLVCPGDPPVPGRRHRRPAPRARPRVLPAKSLLGNAIGSAASGSATCSRRGRTSDRSALRPVARPALRPFPAVVSSMAPATTPGRGTGNGRVHGDAFPVREQTSPAPNSARLGQALLCPHPPPSRGPAPRSPADLVGTGCRRWSPQRTAIAQPVDERHDGPARPPAPPPAHPPMSAVVATPSRNGASRPKQESGAPGTARAPARPGRPATPRLSPVILPRPYRRHGARRIPAPPRRRWGTAVRGEFAADRRHGTHRPDRSGMICWITPSLP